MTHSHVVTLTVTGIAAVCLLTASVLLAETPASDQAGGVTPAPVEPAATDRTENTESIRASRQLNDAYRESFAPPTVGDDKLDTEVQTLIDKINAMSLPEAAPAARPAASPQRPKPRVMPAPVEGDAATDGEQTAKNNETQNTDDEQTRKLGPPEQLPIPPPVLKALAEKQPGALADPLRLADTLFAGGHYAEAATVYQQQLDKADADTDQAWLIYQIANCKADSDRAEAISLYRRIGVEFPNSPWAPLAKTSLELLQWMDQNQPREFLRDLATELNAISKTEHIAKQ